MSTAPLPLVDDVKQALRLSLTDLSQDGAVAGLMAAADSFIQDACNCPILDTTFTEIDRTIDMQPTATFAPPQTLILSHRPINPTAAFTILAEDGSTLANTPVQVYYVDYLKGLVYAVPGNYFGVGPYTITYNAGLVNHPQWSTRYRAIVRQVILDYCAWLYENPNPGAKTEAAGGGVSTTWRDDCVPPRIRSLVKRLPGAALSIGVGL